MSATLEERELRRKTRGTGALGARRTSQNSVPSSSAIDMNAKDSATTTTQMDTSPSAPGEDIIIKRSESDEADLASQEDELAVNEDEEEMQVDSVMPSEVDEDGNHAGSDDAGEGDELQSDKENEEVEVARERLVDLFFLGDGGSRRVRVSSSARREDATRGECWGRAVAFW